MYHGHTRIISQVSAEQQCKYMEQQGTLMLIIHAWWLSCFASACTCEGQSGAGEVEWLVIEQLANLQSG